MDIGVRIYYDKFSGEIVQLIRERSGAVVETTVERDFLVYSALAERVPETVGMIQLDYGQYAEDFRLGILRRVELETEDLLFWYPEPGAGPEPEPPKYSPEAVIALLRAEVAELKVTTESETTALQLAIAESMEQQIAGQEDVTATQIGLAELAQAQASDTDALQLALAEVAALLTGGDL